MTEFGKLNPDGTYEHIRTLPQAAMQACPWLIMIPEHYREDGTCRCDDPEHTELEDWGYFWNDEKERWDG